MVSRNAEFGIVSRNSDTSQGDGTAISAPIEPVEQPQARGTGANTVFKSGFLFISNKGMGWTSWKKRWFILTRTSLVFFRSDPNALPQKSGEVNLTLGGIDLNNSGSVVVKADKKLLTVQFPDGRDGRTFTLKAETSEDLHEWKAALENALAQAPSPALVGQTGIFRNDLSDSLEGSFEQWSDRRSVKCSVVGRPILLALEDADGSPSFLEKALRFLEEYGIKVEGILRQSADVEEVERRIREYEEGKIEFSSEEDAHVVGDCVKHVLREFPSTPVPASCCTALLKAYRNEHEDSVDAIRDAVSEAFPEPNRRLLQRILKMMQTVASNTSVNRMSSSAVAACMAPLLLRPLMAGDCVPENDFDISGDGCSAQLLAAAAAANQAYAIVSILLEEYEYIFLDGLRKGSISSDMYSESGSEVSGSEEESNYDDELLGIVEDGYHDAQNDLDHHLDDDPERSSSGTLSESSDNVGSDIYDDQGSEGPDSDGNSPKDDTYFEAQPKPSQETLAPVHHHSDLQRSYSNLQTPKDNSKAIYARESHDTIGDLPVSTIPKLNSSTFSVSSCTTKPISKVNESMHNMKRHTFWGRTSARKNLSMESINYSSEDETAIQRLEITKNDLQSKIEKEAKGNAILHSSLERRKQALHERRLALEQDVARLQVQLQRERDLRAALEAGLNMVPGQLYVSSIMDSKIKAELEEIALAEEDVTNLKQKVADLHRQLNQQCQHSSGSLCDSCNQNQCADNHQETGKTQVQDVESRSSARHLERSQRSENFSSGADSGKLRTQGKLSLQNKENSRRQKPDSPSLLHSKSTEEVITVLHSTAKKLPSKTIEASTTSEDPVSVVPATGKRTPARSEGTNSMSLALSKLTTRLNFLKERRTQLTNEIQTLDPALASDSQDLPKTESI